jgi:hypothetical protein
MRLLTKFNSAKNPAAIESYSSVGYNTGVRSKKETGMRFATWLLIFSAIYGCETRTTSPVSEAKSSDVELHSQFERFEGDSYEAEMALVKSLANKFALAQSSLASQIGRMLRGTHAKGSCIDGTIELAQLGPEFQVGPYGRGGQFDARIRFANASSKIQSDLVPDVRSVSISFVANGQRTDLSMNNDPSFTFTNVTDFNNFMAFVLRQGNLQSQVAKGLLTKEGAEQSMQAFFRENPDVAASVQRANTLGTAQQKKDVLSYVTENYYTGTAFLYGKDRAAKFKLVQCGNKPPLRQKPSPQAGSEYLQEDLRQRVTAKAAKICFDLAVEFLDVGKMRDAQNKALEAWQWVEDPTLNWTAAGTPSQILGQVRAKANSFKSPAACDDPAMGFDVNVHSHADVRPLGRINRARRAAEAQSQKLRGSLKTPASMEK